MKSYTEFLSKIPLFEGVNKDVINKISENILEKQYRDNEIIFVEGTIGENLYIIYSGTVEIVKNYNQQNQKLLSVLTQGEIFGETSLFTKSERSATAVAKGDTVILSVPSEVFLNIFKTQQSEGIKIVNWMLFNTISRLEQTSKELASIYTISQIIIDSISKMENIEVFLNKVATEVENVLPQFCSFGIYIYNIFNEEFNLVCYKGEKRMWVKEIYDVKDEFLQTVLYNQQEIKLENDKVYIFYLKETEKIVGFIMVVYSLQFSLSQRNIDLLNSISNLVSISVTSLRNLYEQKEKLRLESVKTRYTF